MINKTALIFRQALDRYVLKVNFFLILKLHTKNVLYIYQSLNLSGNEFSEKGGEYLGKGLAMNESIEELDLSWNHLRGKV